MAINVSVQYNGGLLPDIILLIQYYYLVLSLRHHKLVSGYECGRVFPAGVGPGSPSRDAVNGCLRHSAGRLRRAAVVG